MREACQPETVGLPHDLREPWSTKSSSADLAEFLKVMRYFSTNFQ
jgi:hypothetical protein